MRSVVVTLLMAGGVAIVARTTTAPNFNHQTAPIVRAIIEGVILGSATWPSTPVDVQARLQLLRPAGCEAAGRCDSSEE